MSTSLVGSGIAHTAQDGTGTKVLLPLEEVKVTTSIVDVSAKVVIYQRYSNPSDVATSRCKYFFSVPANAAICAFQMQTEHGRVVVGICKEKNQAQQEFEAALASGKSVGLMEYVNDDTFVISIGSIPARTIAEINLTYVVSLMNDDVPNGIRFQLPMAVGHRYGTTPAPLRDAVQPQSEDQTRVEVSVDIQTHGAIEEVKCISHPQDTIETKYTTHSGRVSHRRLNVTYRSASFLDREFLLIIHAERLDEPRCFAELFANPEQGRANTLALQLAIIPRLTLPSVPSQEYIFLIDRSGSMQGASIKVAKETLMLLLRLIPSSSSTFNIFSFGSSVEAYSPQSQLYNQANLEAATAYVDAMDANMGGTEIRGALLDVFAKWSRTLAVAIFVLTDGGAYDIEATADAVRSAVQFKPGPPARVYTLGIGDGVSTAMCESIARAGNGIGLFALSAESIVGRCARLFHAGSKQTVKNITIDWNVPNDMVNGTERASVRFVGEGQSHSSRISWRTPSIQQAPSRVSALHADIKINVYAILTIRQGQIPQSVKLQGQIEDTTGVFEITVPVRGVQINDNEPSVAMIHTLAAWHIIQEHQEKVAPLPRTVTAPRTEDDMRRAVIIHLGERYQLISAHTSFVAVDRGGDYEDSISDVSIDDNDVGDSLGAVQNAQDYPDDIDSASGSEPSLDSQHSEDEATRRGARVQARHSRRGKTAFAKVVGSVFSWVTSAFTFRPAASNFRRRGNEDIDGDIEPELRIPGGWNFTDEGNVDGNRSDGGRTFTTLSSLSCSSCDGSRSTLWLPRRPIPTDDDRRAYRSPSPPLFSSTSLGGPSGINHQTSSGASGPRDKPVRPEVVRIVRLQQDDGSFQMSDNLKRIIGNVAFTNESPLGVNERIWATALAVAFLTKNMGSQKELLADILAKPLEFLSRQAGSDELIRHAKALLHV